MKLVCCEFDLRSLFIAIVLAAAILAGVTFIMVRTIFAGVALIVPPRVSLVLFAAVPASITALALAHATIVRMIASLGHGRGRRKCE